MIKNQKGFTLIELVIIIVILGILAAVAIPRYLDLAEEARVAVCDGTKGSLKSTGAIMIGLPPTGGVKVAARGTAATRAEIIAQTIADGWSAVPAVAPGVITVTITSGNPVGGCATTSLLAAGLSSD